MSRPRASSLLLVLLLLASGFLAGASALAPPARAAAAIAVTGSVTGPTVIGTNSTDVYRIFGFGGPAVAANGTVVGNITYYVTPIAPNLTGVAFTPASSRIAHNQSVSGKLTAGNTTESLSLDVEISSTYLGKNESTNLSYTVTIVQPYVVSATIVNPSNVTVGAFTVYVTLDGTVVGQVNVSSLSAKGSTRLTFDYPTLGLSTGSHTFAISLVQEHGLVTFANGQTVYTETVYVTGPAPSYTLWYLAGIVAFFGAIFIFLTRVAARRRGTARR